MSGTNVLEQALQNVIRYAEYYEDKFARGEVDYLMLKRYLVARRVINELAALAGVALTIDQVKEAEQ